MNEFMNWLLDLNSLQWGEESVRLGFARSAPAWLWAGVVITAFAFSAWSYSRMTGSGAGRIALATLRGLLIVSLVALLAGPQLVRTDEDVERDWVLVLVDRSASMTIGDVGEGADRIEREVQLREAISSSWPMWSELSSERTVVWLGFNAGAFDLDATETRVDLGEPSGATTSLAQSLDQAMRRAAARPLSGVVILSDGRSIDEPGRSAIRALRAERVPVHVVPLGSPDPVGDLAVRRAEGPEVAFVNDIAPVTINLDRLGAVEDLGGVVRLIDEATGIVLDEERIEAADSSGALTLTHRPTEPGEATWRVEIVPDRPDLIAGNNTSRIEIELIDRPLRVLYIDGYPRWEERYLKNLLIREKSIISSNLLLAPDRRPGQEGDERLSALPDSPEEWAPFDIVILGDLEADVFTRRQLDDLREHISLRGAGLLWIGGPGATPESWWTTPLADLLPFTRDAGVYAVGGEPSTIVPTPLAALFGVLRLGTDVSESMPPELLMADTGWAQIRWFQRLEQRGVKPTAESLALVAPPDSVYVDELGAPTTSEGSPLILSMRYGAGRSLYVATDELWRWRYGRGELLYERFWLQLIRMLGRESVARTGQSAKLTIEPTRAVVDQPVRIAVEIVDQSLAERDLASIRLQLKRTRTAGEQTEPSPMELVLRPEGDNGRSFSATWLPTEAGRWTADVRETALTGLGLTEEILVSLPDDELRHPETDHELLVALSDETGGVVLDPSNLDSLPDSLPNRRVRLVSETTEDLWDTPFALILLISLLTLEWVGRRLLRFV